MQTLCYQATKRLDNNFSNCDAQILQRKVVCLHIAQAEIFVAKKASIDHLATKTFRYILNLCIFQKKINEKIFNTEKEKNLTT